MDKLNIHTIIKNPAVRESLSHFLPRNTLDVLVTRTRKPAYKTVNRVAMGLKQVYKDDRTNLEIEKWLYEKADK